MFYFKIILQNIKEHNTKAEREFIWEKAYIFYPQAIETVRFVLRVVSLF